MFKYKSFEKGFAPLALLIIVAVLVLGFTAKSYQDRKTSVINTSVLSESSDSGGSGGDSGDSGNSGKSDSTNSNSNQDTSTSKPSVQITTKSVENEIKSPKSTEKPEKIETPEPKETPESEVETEVESEVKDGSISAKIKIRNGTNSSQFEQENSKVEVQGDFPITVDKTSKQLSVTTADGVKNLTVLPDTAVNNVLGLGVVSEITTDAKTGKNSVTLKTDANGNLVYEINGVKFEKLFGIFNVSIDKTTQISAQSGQLTSTQQSAISKLLDLLSI